MSAMKKKRRLTKQGKTQLPDGKNTNLKFQMPSNSKSNIATAPIAIMSQENIIEAGHVMHFFAKINVAAVDLTQPLSVGDTILVKGPTTDFEQNVESMQIERQAIPNAQAGQSIGLKLNQPAKEKDTVYKKL